MVGMEEVATSEVAVEGQRITLAAMQYEEESESKVEDAEIPVKTIAVHAAEFEPKLDAEIPVKTIAIHAAESGLLGRPSESEPLTFRIVEPSIDTAPVTASDPPIQTPIKLRSEPLAYTVSLSLL
jgi:hypothetical protein